VQHREHADGAADVAAIARQLDARLDCGLHQRGISRRADWRAARRAAPPAR
jgi:hypothetical protein